MESSAAPDRSTPDHFEAARNHQVGTTDSNEAADETGGDSFLVVKNLDNNGTAVLNVDDTTDLETAKFRCVALHLVHILIHSSAVTPVYSQMPPAESVSANSRDYTVAFPGGESTQAFSSHS